MWNETKLSMQIDRLELKVEDALFQSTTSTDSYKK